MNNVLKVLTIIGVWYTLLVTNIYHMTVPSIFLVFAKYVLVILLFTLIYKWWFKGTKMISLNRQPLLMVSIILGACLNVFVMIANNGYMPVDPDIFSKHINVMPCYISGGNFLILGDVIKPIGASVGDVLLATGSILMVAVVLTDKVSRPACNWVKGKFRSIRGKKEGV